MRRLFENKINKKKSLNNEDRSVGKKPHRSALFLYKGRRMPVFEIIKRGKNFAKRENAQIMT